MAGPTVPPNERLIRRGPLGSVEFAVRWDGTSEAKEWFEALPSNLQSGFDVLFSKILLARTSMNKLQFRRIGNRGVFEFKKRGQRLFCVLQGSRYLLTHGEKKGSTGENTGRISPANRSKTSVRHTAL